MPYDTETEENTRIRRRKELFMIVKAERVDSPMFLLASDEDLIATINAAYNKDFSVSEYRLVRDCLDIFEKTSESFQKRKVPIMVSSLFSGLVAGMVFYGMSGKAFLAFVSFCLISYATFLGIKNVLNLKLHKEMFFKIKKGV